MAQNIYGQTVGGLLYDAVDPLRRFITQNPLESAAIATAPIPVVGDVTGLISDAAMFATDPESRTLGNAALAALGILPFIPAASVVKALSPAEEMAKKVIDLLKSGKADEVTEEMLEKADPAYLAKNYDLPMDTESRMARAREMGFGDEVLYHGSTHDFSSFGGGPRNPEGHFGQGDYFTTSPLDADKNYAGAGPDLTGRLETRAERLVDEGMDEATALAAARKELMGDAPLGTIYPVKVRGSEVDVQNYTRGRPTTIEADAPRAEDYLDRAKRELGKGGDEDEVYDLAQSYADDNYQKAFEESPLGDIAHSLQRSANEFDDVDIDEALQTLNEAFYDGFIGADDLDRKLRKTLDYATDESGALVGNEIIRRAFRDAGFENIRMDAPSAFPSMKNVPKGTKHIIANDPKNIRSVFARFDPRLQNLRNLNAGVAVPVLGSGVLAGLLAEERTRRDEELVPIF